MSKVEANEHNNRVTFWRAAATGACMGAFVLAANTAVGSTVMTPVVDLVALGLNKFNDTIGGNAVYVSSLCIGVYTAHRLQKLTSKYTTVAGAVMTTLGSALILRGGESTFGASLLLTGVFSYSVYRGLKSTIVHGSVTSLLGGVGVGLSPFVIGAAMLSSGNGNVEDDPEPEPAQRITMEDVKNYDPPEFQPNVRYIEVDCDTPVTITKEYQKLPEGCHFVIK